MAAEPSGAGAASGQPERLAPYPDVGAGGGVSCDGCRGWAAWSATVKVRRHSHDGGYGVSRALSLS